MICWSCQRRVEPASSCSHCKAVLPPEGAKNLFDVLGIPHRFTQDVKAVESAYKKLARSLHPDRFARSDPQARRAAMQQTVLLNEAWRTIKDDFKRANYLLERMGYGLTDEGGSGASEANKVVELSPEFLADMLERREALMDAGMEGDLATVNRMADKARADIAEDMAIVSGELDSWPKGDLKAAAYALSRVRYGQRFVQEADAFVAKADALGATGGGLHAG